MKNARRAALIYRQPPALSNQIRRGTFRLVWLVFCRPTPILLHGWRRFVLRLFGARIEAGAHIYPTCRIWAPWNLVMAKRSCLAANVDCYNVDRIELRACAIVSQGSFLCSASHDHNHPDFPLVTAPIRIDTGAWICAEAFVGPGVRVHSYAVVAARAVVNRDVDAASVVAGNPAMIVGARDSGAVPADTAGSGR